MERLTGAYLVQRPLLYAIARRNPDKVRAFKEEFGFEKGYDSLDALLEEEKVDAVYIPLPNHLHKEWILKAAKCVLGEEAEPLVSNKLTMQVSQVIQ